MSSIINKIELIMSSIINKIELIMSSIINKICANYVLYYK